MCPQYSHLGITSSVTLIESYGSSEKKLNANIGLNAKFSKSHINGTREEFSGSDFISSGL